MKHLKKAALLVSVAAATLVTQNAASAAPSINKHELDNRPCVSRSEWVQTAHYTNDWDLKRFNQLFDVAGYRDHTVEGTDNGKPLIGYSWKLCNVPVRRGLLTATFNQAGSAGLVFIYESHQGFTWAETEPQRRS